MLGILALPGACRQGRLRQLCGTFPHFRNYENVKASTGLALAAIDAQLSKYDKLQRPLGMPGIA